MITVKGKNFDIIAHKMGIDNPQPFKATKDETHNFHMQDSFKHQKLWEYSDF